jgi:hypothetical protein
MASLRELMKTSANLKEAGKKPKISLDKDLVGSLNSKNGSVQAVKTILEMLKNDALTKKEKTKLMDSISSIFANVLMESCESCDDDEYNEMMEYACVEGDWIGTEAELVDGACPSCGGEVEESDFDENEDYISGEWDEDEDEPCCEPDENGECTCDEDEDEDFNESMFGKSTSAEKRAAKLNYRKNRSKIRMRNKKIRRMFGKKISAMRRQGKTFSLRTHGAIKSKKYHV